MDLHPQAPHCGGGQGWPGPPGLVLLPKHPTPLLHPLPLPPAPPRVNKAYPRSQDRQPGLGRPKQGPHLPRQAPPPPVIMCTVAIATCPKRLFFAVLSPSCTAGMLPPHPSSRAPSSVPHFTDEETEAQRGKRACPRAHRELTADPYLESRSPDSNSGVSLTLRGWRVSAPYPITGMPHPCSPQASREAVGQLQ